MKVVRPVSFLTDNKPREGRDCGGWVGEEVRMAFEEIDPVRLTHQLFPVVFVVNNRDTEFQIDSHFINIRIVINRLTCLWGWKFNRTTLHKAEM